MKSRCRLCRARKRRAARLAQPGQALDVRPARCLRSRRRPDFRWHHGLGGRSRSDGWRPCRPPRQTIGAGEGRCPGLGQPAGEPARRGGLGDHGTSRAWGRGRHLAPVQVAHCSGVTRWIVPSLRPGDSQLIYYRAEAKIGPHRHARRPDCPASGHANEVSQGIGYPWPLRLYAPASAGL